jgi:methylated-DNA-[protein]-cysteine S-methyltransferase
MNAIAMSMPVADDLTVRVATFDSPLGVLHVACVPDGICAVAFDDRREALEPRLRRTFGAFFRIEEGDPLGVCERLDAYFGGDLAALSGVRRAVPATPMQRRVWALVADLAPGTTTTYAALAACLGMPRAQRAVGVCLASNPVPIFIPCHRVVAASGAIASHPGGAARKQWLLHHEGARIRAEARRMRSRPARNALDAADVVHLVLPRTAY